MALVHFVDMVGHAYRHNYAVGAFGVDDQIFLEGVLQAAENSRAPVVLNLIESHFSGRDFALFAQTAAAAARHATVPVAINYDHGGSQAGAERAIAAGCNAVMVDTSMLPFSDNLHETRELVAMAHACGVAVEGELGYVPGVDGDSATEHPGELTYTSAAEARTFVERTGVDCLAVSVGTVHGHMKGSPRLDYGRLTKIHEAVDVPLVVHGGTDLTEDQARKLISHGVAKINYYTGLADAAALYLKKHTAAQRNGGYAALVSGVRDTVREQAERCLRTWGSGGRAAEVLAQCRSWQEIEQVGLFYTPGTLPGEAEIVPALHAAKTAIQTIPGVRAVRVGRALQHGGRTHYGWLVTLASKEAAESFRAHPAVQSLANRAALSFGADWVTADFTEL